MKDEYFKTIDLGFAAYLCCEGFMFLGAVEDPSDKYPNQKAFIFEDKPDKRVRLEEAFRTGRGDTVSASHYSKMVRMVSSKAKNAALKQSDLKKNG